ncbi:MAG: PilZ domain-containing protein [Bdellovibrionota bacterium]
MIVGNYQRRYLRAPHKGKMLYLDGQHVYTAQVLNISEDGMLVENIPNFPEAEELPLMLSLPQYPLLKGLTFEDLVQFRPENLSRTIFRAKVRIVRKGELARDISNLFKAKVGMQYVRILPHDKKVIEEYVSTFGINLIHLQTLIDAYNFDEDAKLRTRVVAKLLGYQEDLKVAQLRIQIASDYQSLQWL